MPQKLHAGKRWVTEVLEGLGHSNHEWGSTWREVPKARTRSTRPAAEQLILHAGRRKKIVWISTEELREAGGGSGLARARIREAVADALSELLQRAG